MPTKEDLKYFQSMPLDIKVAMTKTRIREWVTYHGISSTCISFSGGKDSTVLLHIARKLYPDIPAVFVNTGLEFPEIQSFAKSFDNVIVLRPKMRFDEVIKTFGYPMIGKKQSNCISGARMSINKNKYSLRLANLGVDESEAKKLGLEMPSEEMLERYKKSTENSKYNIPQYRKMLDVDFYVSEKCCDVMKKAPAFEYQKQTGSYPILATMASESMMRTNAWLKHGCNAFDMNHPSSQPMSFWTENDVLQYIVQNDLRICSVYGDIIPEDEQLRFDGCEDCKLCTTGESRTGCIFCGFGAHLDKYSRFLRLKETHPKQYRYCMDGGEYDIDGLWKPNNKGLGMAHVIDELNRLFSKDGKTFIDY